jgi:hypothetical protein
MAWATFWAIFSQTHLVTLLTVKSVDDSNKEFNQTQQFSLVLSL